MTLIPKSEVRNVLGITDEENLAIYNFIQGAVYCWCKNNPGQWFSMRTLMGGDNYYWEGTPLYVLYQKHIKGKEFDSAVEAAGKDSGWILKKVIDNDLREFKTKKEDLIRKYYWNKPE